MTQKEFILQQLASGQQNYAQLLQAAFHAGRTHQALRASLEELLTEGRVRRVCVSLGKDQPSIYAYERGE